MFQEKGRSCAKEQMKLEMSQHITVEMEPPHTYTQIRDHGLAIKACDQHLDEPSVAQDCGERPEKTHFEVPGSDRVMAGMAGSPNLELPVRDRHTCENRKHHGACRSKGRFGAASRYERSYV